MTANYDTTKLPNDELKTRLLAQRPADTHQPQDTLIRNSDNWVHT